jgi:DNA-binding LacI/PurR family transcriptional regulator
MANVKQQTKSPTPVTKITLKDISDDTGLSISTVSRVLRGEGRSSGQNEQVIIESAQRLGYPLQKEQTPFELRREIYIAVITLVSDGEFYTAFFNGFHQASKNTNVHFCLFSVDNFDMPIHEFIFGLKKHFDAAVIFLPSLTNEDYKKILNKVNISFPIISTSSLLNPVLDTISFDGYGGGHLVAEHFFNKNYLDVGIIHGPYNKLESRFRSNGFVDYVKSQPKMDLVWEYNGDYSAKSGQAAFASFKNSAKKPRAVFCANDSMLIGFLELARAEGIKIPSELALFGYDNLPICETYYPKISSVKTDYTSLGLNTMRLLMDRLENHISHQGFLSLIPVSLEIRESS